MKIKIFNLLIFLAVLSACKPINNHSGLVDNKDLANFFERYWDHHLRLNPLEATQEGDYRFNALLPNDQTVKFRDSLHQFYQSSLDSLSTFKYEDLNANDKISYDMFSYNMKMDLEGLKNNLWMIPFNQFWGLPISMGQLGSGSGAQPFKTVADYDNWLARIKAFTNWSDSSIVNFKKGISAGVILPKALVIKIIPQLNALVVTDPEKSLFFTPVTKFPTSFSVAEKQRLTAAFKASISTELVPAYARLESFLRTEYLPKARLSSGISAIPGGAADYVFLVKSWTTINESPEEIYQTGLKEVSRIRHTMDSVRQSVGFKGDLKAFFEYMKNDPRFMPYKTPEQVLQAFEAIHKRMLPKLSLLYSHVPKTNFEIRQTEAFRAASSSAEYMQGTADGSRPGIFYVPILDATKFNTTSGMESLFLHEAIPGHHYQISLQQENKSLPKFRRFSWYGAYGEGYALYCESLGKELGLYTDPYQYMGALGDEIHRAIRLVVDVALHTKSMTREQAITYMIENEAIDEGGATAEIERYMAIPGQALSYKIGALKIRALRAKYKQELGNKFKIAEFHNQLLKDGCMPLAIVEKKLDAWALTLK